MAASEIFVINNMFYLLYILFFKDPRGNMCKCTKKGTIFVRRMCSKLTIKMNWIKAILGVFIVNFEQI